MRVKFNAPNNCYNQCIVIHNSNKPASPAAGLYWGNIIFTNYFVNRVNVEFNQQ